MVRDFTLRLLVFVASTITSISHANELKKRNIPESHDCQPRNGVPGRWVGRYCLISPILVSITLDFAWFDLCWYPLALQDDVPSYWRWPITPGADPSKALKTAIGRMELANPGVLDDDNFNIGRVPTESGVKRIVLHNCPHMHTCVQWSDTQKDAHIVCARKVDDKTFYYNLPDYCVWNGVGYTPVQLFGPALLREVDDSADEGASTSARNTPDELLRDLPRLQDCARHP